MAFEQKKFRYIIVDPDNGEVSGTNDSDLAVELSQQEELWVIDCTNNAVMYEGSITSVPIEEFKP